MNSHHELSGIILAGGRGSRMGGRDKGLVRFDGKTLVQHVIERISPQVDDIVISANRNTDVYAGTGLRVVRDRKSAYEGPLAGIQACLPHCSHEYILVVAVDMPRLPADLASLLCRGLDGTELAIIAVASRLQPAFVMHRDLGASLEKYLASGKRSLMDWIGGTSHRVIAATNEKAFLNINRMQQTS